MSTKAIPPYLGTHLTFWSSPDNSKLLLSWCRHCWPLMSCIEDGQLWVLQDLYWTRFPMQYFPPFSGAGELQCLWEDWTPPPQGRLQSVKALQGPQPPSIFLNALRSWRTHFAFWHQFPLPGPPQLVPSAHGIACERQPSLSVSPGVTHHKALHSGWLFANFGSLVSCADLLPNRPYHIGTDFTAGAKNQFALLMLIKLFASQFRVGRRRHTQAVLWGIQHALAVIIPEPHRKRNNLKRQQWISKT